MARRKHLFNKATGQIRVLLVEDDDMARAGWKRVLGKSDQIRVVGETTLHALIKNIEKIPLPEIIITGFSFVERGMILSDELKKTWGNFPKNIIICENKEQVRIAYRSHADWATTKPFIDQDLVTWVRALSDDAKRLCSEYLAELVSIEKGSGQQQKFLKLVYAMLQLLFHPDLVNPEKIDLPDSPQSISPGRFVFRNQAKKENSESNGGKGEQKFDDFWEDARQNHESKYVAVDICNSEIDFAAIQRLGKYLTSSHGLLGLIIGRIPIKPRHYPLTVALFENEKKVILLLGDAELQEMLEYKAGGVNPVCLLKDLYQNLMVKADG